MSRLPEEVKCINMTIVMSAALNTGDTNLLPTGKFEQRENADTGQTCFTGRNRQVSQIQFDSFWTQRWHCLKYTI